MHITVVPLGDEEITTFDNVDEDERLVGFKCTKNRKCGGRYFQHENKKY